jgi:small conductance mechanosensitive channel
MLRAFIKTRAVGVSILALILLILLLPPLAQAQLSPEKQQALQEIIDARTAEVEQAAEPPAGAGASVPESTAPAQVEAAEPAQPVAPAATPAVDELAAVLADPALREALIEVLRATQGEAAPAPDSAPAPQAETTAAPPPPAPMGGLAGMAAATLAATSGSGEASADAQTEGSGETAAESSNPDGAATGPLSVPGISLLTNLFHDFYDNVIWTWVSDITNQAPQVLDWLRLQVDDDMRGVWLHLGWQIALVVAAGLATSLVARLALRGLLRRLQDKAAESRDTPRLVFLVVRLALSLLPIIVFAVTAQATMPLIEADLRTELVAAAVITTLILYRAVTLVLRGLFSHKDPAVRLIPISDDAAWLVFRGLRRIALTVILGYLAVEIARLFGMPPGGRALFAHIIGFVVLAFSVRTVFTLRHVGKRALRRVAQAGPSSTAWIMGLLKGLADVWHVLASAYAIGIFFAWVLDSERWFALAGWATLKTALVCALTLLLFGWVQRLRDRVVMRLHSASTLDRSARQRARRYIGIVSTVLRTLVLAGALVLILESWHMGAVGWLSSGFGLRLLTMIFNIGVALLISIALWEGVNRLIQRYLSTTDSAGNLVERGQRERTLLPLLRNVLTVFLVVVVALILLSELGIDIAPLLAGAGVVGLAIGFGSQKLVQDVISGVFNLLENTIAVGDVVQVGGLAGVVEAMSIRSLRLRDLSGNLHTIPFSNVDTVTNMTKDFSYYLMDVGVAYRENTDHVTQVLKEVGADMQVDPEYGPNILEPLEVLGVDGFADSAVILKARIKTKPIMQWWVGREFNRRMKMRFDELGIEIPFPHTTLYFGVDKEGNAPPAHLHVDRLADMGKEARPAARATSASAPAASSPPVPPPVFLPDPDGDGDGGGR